MEMSDVYEDLGMVQLGDCTTPELFDDGKHPASYGMYSRDCEGCELYEAEVMSRMKCCGNCKHWEGTDQYE